MVSSVEVPPIITSSADPIDGGADLVNQYLNEDAMSSGQPSSSPMPSSRGLTPSSEGRQPSSTNASQNGGSHRENRNLDDSKGAGDGLKNHRGARSVSKLTPQQLARKRANDREAQRAIRQRTKEHIDNLEREIQELKSHTPEWAVRQRNQELEELVQILKQQLAAERMDKARLVEATRQTMPMDMSAEAQNMSDISWPALSQPCDQEGMTAFNPQSIGVSQPGEVTGTGNDLLQQYANVNQLITPYPSAASTTGNFADLDNSALNYGTLPGQDDLIGLPGDIATPSWTTSMNPSFPMGDPNMLSPPNRYLNSEDVPYPYDTKPPTLQSQQSNPQQQLQPPSMQAAPAGPPIIKHELSPTPMPNQPLQVQTPQPMRQLTSSLPTPPELDIERRQMQEQHQNQQNSYPHQRPLQPNFRPNIQPNTRNLPRMQPQQQQNHPQQQRKRAPSLQQQAGGIPIAPAPPPPAHLQRRQPSSQSIPPMSQEPQIQLQRQRQQQQQQQQLQQAQLQQAQLQQAQLQQAQMQQAQMQQAQMQQHQQRQLSPQNPQQQMQANIPQQPSIPYWAQTPIFLPPTCTIDSLLHSALAQHRNSVQNGGTNHRAPDYSTLLSLSTSAMSSSPCPLAPASNDPSPLSSAISRAIHVAGFRGLATRAAVLYTTHCLLRWQADPQPETYAHIPDWLRPGRMQLTMPHALWVSQLVWRGLREWVATQGGRYVQDEFILCYARNVKIDWEGQGRSLTGGTSPGRRSSREKAFESGVFELGANGEVIMTGKFEQAVRELGNWGMRREFLANYPELGECVGKARDSFSS